MDKRHIQRNIGKVVAYTERGSAAVYPAKILDGHLWEKSTFPHQRVEISKRTRSYRSAGLKVGYPVLIPQPGVHMTHERRRELENYLRSTVVTMGHLFDEEGNPKGNFLGEIEGLIFRVAFPQDLYEDYTAKRREQIFAKKAHEAAMCAEQIRYGKLRDKTVVLSNILAGLGVQSTDKFSIVSPGNVEAQRVSLPVGVLEELIRVAEPVMRGCRWCGEHDFLLPHQHASQGAIMLCATCHPRVSLA